MSFAVEFLSGADADLQEAFNRFEDYHEGFGVEFMMAVDAYLARIATFPHSAPVYLETVRRQVMRRFPYGIFYEAHPTRILITAILDLRQDPETIRSRLRRQ
jgi:plasmid stabilization system protein ParE